MQQEAAQDTVASAGRRFTIDQLLVRAGGFGPHQCGQAVLCAACNMCTAAACFLPNFLYPRLRTAWPELTEASTATLGSIFFLGNTAGLLFWGGFADTHGRRPAVNAALAMLILASVATFSSVGFESLAVARAFAGFAVGGVLNASTVLLLEVVPPHRRMSGKLCLVIGGWVPGQLWLTCVAYLMRERDLAWLGVAHLLPAPFLLLATTRWLDESPRYLLTSSEHGDAAATAALVRVAHTNGSPLPAGARVASILHRARPRIAPAVAATANGCHANGCEAKNGGGAGGGGGECGGGADGDGGSNKPGGIGVAVGSANGPHASGGRRYSLRERAAELLHPSLRRRTLLVGLAWFGSTCVYYGVALSSHSSHDESIYMHNLLGALLEFVAYLLMPLLSGACGRSATWTAFLALGAMPLLAISALPLMTADSHFGHPLHTRDFAHHVHRHGHAHTIEDPEPEPMRRLAEDASASGSSSPLFVVVALQLLARVGATGAAAIAYVAAAEHFPTTSRNLAVGYGASCGRIGSILAPLLRLTRWPNAVLGGIGTSAALAAFLLPETAGDDLPETVGAQRVAANCSEEERSTRTPLVSR